MNKYIFILFFSSLFAQIEYSNYLNFRYGNGADDYTYDEIYSNLGITLNRPEHRFEASLSLELSNPPEIGLKEEGVREFLLGYYNENFYLSSETFIKHGEEG